MKAYVINLDHRTDRWAECQDLPFELIRYRALPHQHGWQGLLATMHELFNAIDGPALILEDDAVMVRDIEHLHRAIADLPDNFDMLMLGANIQAPVSRHSKHLNTTFGAWTTHAIYYSDAFIKEMRPIIADLTVPIDEYYRVEIHPRGRSYICKPMVAYQRASHSDIMGTMADYHDIFENSNSLLK
jgi:GR25 family glycosyltransferase involved in LPS biosynthesis